MAEQIGRAYAFFDCDASKRELDKSLRNYKKIPAGLELQLYEGTSGMQFDEKLLEHLDDPDDFRIMSHERFEQEKNTEEGRALRSLKYLLIANYRNASNEDAAVELEYLTYLIHGQYDYDKSLYRRGIVYQEKDGEYQLKG